MRELLPIASAVPHNRHPIDFKTPWDVRPSGSDWGNPFVYAVGFRVDEHLVCTIVLPRESLPFLDLSMTTYE